MISHILYLSPQKWTIFSNNCDSTIAIFSLNMLQKWPMYDFWQKVRYRKVAITNRMHFICFIVFPNASQNRIIFCDRMITNHAVLLQKVSSSFLSIFLINLINQESSGGPTLILSISPLDTRSTLRERL